MKVIWQRMKKNSSYNNVYWIVILILFAAFILRIYSIGEQSLWLDEIIQVKVYNYNSILEVIDGAANQAQPPLDYLIGFLLLKIFPFSETIVRLPAAIFGTLIVYMIFILTRLLYSQNAAILASILAAISSYLVMYAQEARPYSIFILALLMTLYFYFRVLESSKIINWAGFAISLYFLLMTRGFEPLIVILVINILTILFYRFSRRTFVIASLSLADFILFLPFFIRTYSYLQYYSETQINSMTFWENITNKMQDFPFTNLVNMWHSFTSPVSILFIVFIVFGYYAILSNKEKKNARIFACFSVFLPILHVVIFTYKVDLIHRAAFASRYYVYTLALIFILTAIGAVSLFEFIRSRSIHKYFSYATGIVIFLFIIAYGTNLKAYYASEKQDWRGVSAYIKKDTRKHNIIVTDSVHQVYGQWMMRFEGRPIYYKDAKELNLNEFVEIAIKMSNYKFNGDIYLVLHNEWPIDKNIYCKELCQNKFTVFCVYKLVNYNERVVDRLETLIDTMIKEYPQNGSRIRLYLNKARIRKYRGDLNSTYDYIEKSRNLVLPGYSNMLEHEIKGILEDL